MVARASKLRVASALASSPEILKARPSINWFFRQYLRKFTVINVGGTLVLHSHLPPLNSKAYKRFIHNGRSGNVMDTETILRVVRDLKSMGVFWIGLTGGEPLLNKDLTSIVEIIGDGCASKLFTTGCGLTDELTSDLKQAGLLYVTVSLDHWDEKQHDKVRRYKGAYRTALRAIERFLNVGGIHVSVSAVLSKEMIQGGLVEEFLHFLEGLKIHEAWLSETKPSVEAYWKKDLLVTDEERAALIALQDRYNKRGEITVNYLSHFEDAQHFGCTAGHKMVYVDVFGEVSPCVFIPMTFGNVQERSIREIVGSMRAHFPTENKCFINKNYGILQKHSAGGIPIQKEDSAKIMNEIEFGPLAKFFELQYR